MAFALWNDRLLQYFFGSFADGQRVRLGVTQELFDNEFSELGGFEEFTRVVVRGPDWPSLGAYHWGQPAGVPERAKGLHSQWTRRIARHRDYVQPMHDGPPYFNYLCLFCLAWTLDSPVLGSNNFYDRLAELHPRHGLASLGELKCLWEGLAAWTARHKGRIGTFIVEQLGALPHVGIPKAQVILTAAKMGALPKLFCGLGVQPGGQVTVSAMRDVLLSNRATAQQFLGNAILASVCADDDLGRSAVRQLVEHLNVWDGYVPMSVPVEERGPQGTRTTQRAIGRLLLGLKPDASNSAWNGQLYVTLDYFAGGAVTLSHNGTAYFAGVNEGFGAPLRRTDNEKTLDPFDVTPGQSLAAVWSDEALGERQVTLTLQNKQLRVLTWHNGCLVEQPSLPCEGYAYLLVHDSIRPHVESWAQSFPRLAFRTDLPQRGLGNGHSLFCVDSLAAIDEKAWARLPDGGSQERRRPKQLRLEGGSYVRHAGFRRVYLPYDPPRIVVEAEGDITVSSDGAPLIERRQQSLPPSWAPHGHSTCHREYYVEPDDGCALVTVTLSRKGVSLGNVAFSLLRSQTGLCQAPEGRYQIDCTGRYTADVLRGAVGTLCPATSHWHYPDGHFSEWPCSDPDTSLPAFRFIDWMAHRGRSDLQRIHALFARRAGAYSFSRELEALAQLGHIEIESDTKGRWAYVHACPPTLYPLPNRRRGLYQYVLGGSYRTEVINAILSEAAAVGVTTEVHPQLGGGRTLYSFVPHRFMILCNDQAQAQGIAAKSGIGFVPAPPAWLYANWAATIQEWASTLTWYPEIEDLSPDGVYLPHRFRTSDIDDLAPWQKLKLSRRLDVNTRRHFSYSLTRAGQDKYHHCHISQKAWAVWYVHGGAMRALFENTEGGSLEQFPIALRPKEDAIVVPMELEPPLLLSRALTLCSGLAAFRLNADEFPAYCSPNNGFGFPYNGQCLSFTHVPTQIADLVLAKLGAYQRRFPDN